MSGVERIAHERQRQIEKEGYASGHDDVHTNGELALFAALYATPILLYQKEEFATAITFSDPYPSKWDAAYDKRPHSGNGNFLVPNTSLSAKKRIRQLEKAGALIAAEIDRLLRLEKES